MSASAYIDALEEIEKQYEQYALDPISASAFTAKAAEVSRALVDLDSSDIMFRHYTKKRQEYDEKRMLGDQIVNAVGVICDPESSEDKITKAKEVLAENAAKEALIAETYKKKLDDDLSDNNTSERLRKSKNAEEAANIAAIGSLDKVEADKLKIRVNERTATYHEKYDLIVKKCNVYLEDFTKAMERAEVLILAYLA
jgi:hypothetical protein